MAVSADAPVFVGAGVVVVVSDCDAAAKNNRIPVQEQSHALQKRCIDQHQYGSHPLPPNGPIHEPRTMAEPARASPREPTFFKATECKSSDCRVITACPYGRCGAFRKSEWCGHLNSVVGFPQTQQHECARYPAGVRLQRSEATQVRCAQR